MAKDPAFLFYPNDWIGGTMGMTFEQKGAYMELLMLQFNRGHMTEHMIGHTVGLLWDGVKDKFIQDDGGLWYNVRLEEEKTKRKEFTASRRNNVLGANQYTKKSGHMSNHMVNGDEDNISLNTKKKNGKENGLSGNFKARPEELMVIRMREGIEAANKARGTDSAGEV